METNKYDEQALGMGVVVAAKEFAHAILASARWYVENQKNAQMSYRDIMLDDIAYSYILDAKTDLRVVKTTGRILDLARDFYRQASAVGHIFSDNVTAPSFETINEAKAGMEFIFGESLFLCVYLYIHIHR